MIPESAGLASRISGQPSGQLAPKLDECHDFENPVAIVRAVLTRLP
jgi:hypothetical protein